MTQRLLTARIWVAVFTVVAVTGCSAISRRETEKIIASNLISDDQEFALGLQVHEELKKGNVKFLENQKVGLYVEGLANRLVPAARRERELGWQYFIIDDPKTVNAFATPGGRVYVYTGLLLAAENEAEVIGVMGHEMGHVVARHSARQLVAAKGLQTVVAMALGKEPNELAQLVAGLTGQGALLAYGRDMEIEADEHGARYSSSAGYDPRALSTFFEKLKAKYGDQPAFLVWLSTHPSSSDRINHLAEYVAMNNLGGSDLGADRLRGIQRELGAK